MHHFVINLIKTTAHQMRIFSSISTRKRLAAGLCPDPLGELKRSSRPPSREKGEGKGERRREGKDKGDGKREEGRIEEGKEGDGRRGGGVREGGGGEGLWTSAKLFRGPAASRPPGPRLDFPRRQ